MIARRVIVVLAALVVAALLIAGHVVYWYRPRARPATLDPSSPVAALLAAESFPAALWLPYPHQNLAAVAPAEAQRDFLEAFARLSGLPPPVMPSFGGFSIVPASELALAADEHGERFVVMARVYPLLAAFSRFAGRLGSNPWLAGGVVTLRGRPAVVAWRGDVWLVHDAGSSPPVASVAAGDVASEDVAGHAAARNEADAAPCLAMLALHRPTPPFPAGRYCLRRVDGGLEVRSASAVAEDLWWTASSLVDPELVLLLLAGHAADGERAHALAFFAQDAESRSLPLAATFNQRLAPGRGGERWSVPGKGLVRLAGGLDHAELAGWELEALGPTSLARARDLAPRLGPLAGVGELPASSSPLVWGLWSDLANNHAEVERLARMLAENPLTPRREADRWRDAAEVLAPLAHRFGHLLIVVAEHPHALRLRLEGRPSAVD